MHKLARSRLALVILLVSAPALAHAQLAAAGALAEQLFKEGRALVRAGKYADACPKFAASLRHDAAPGTRLNLADCYEHVGKLASAWTLYRDVIDIARKTDDERRRRFASQRIAVLGRRLPRLTIEVASTAGAEDFVVTRDGVTVDPTIFGLATFVDPGDHEVVAIATGFEAQLLRIAVAEAQSATIRVPPLVRTRGDAVAVARQAAGTTDNPEEFVHGTSTVPPLDARHQSVPAPTLPGPSTAVQRSLAPQRHGGDGPADGRGLRLAGLGTAGAGLAAVGLGAYFGVRAKSLSDDLSRPGVVYDVDQYASGQAAERNMYISIAAGGLFIAGGVTLYLIGRRNRAPAAHLTLAPDLAPGHAGLVLTGGLP